ncbi:heavy metal translocating P-type ATPase [Salinisphaera sp. T31B1]|uniref:heavy metal translocating P-type ATPase n=1 Tax=Salinisphaera sp. T31B1 TaxID=727963 RepID=UPI00334259B3
MSTLVNQNRYRIDGMDCASCAAKIEGAARRVKGVNHVDVSVAARSMTIEHDDEVRLDKLEKRIRTLGYGARRLAADEGLSPSAESACCEHEHRHGQCGHGEPDAFDAPLESDDQRRVTRYQVHGMDCASCAAKIDGAARRVNGVDEVQVSVATTSMSVRHAPDANLARLEKRIGALGYGVQRLTANAPPSDAQAPCGCGHDHASSHDEPAADSDKASSPPPWYRHAKIMTTAACGAALAVAFGLSQVMPAYAVFFFGVAMLIGLIPVARRAITGALLAGTPFSIEMLMTIAAVGAVALGATREAAVVVLLFLIGEWLEGVAAGRARSSISALADLVPKTARIVDPQGTIREVAADTLDKGVTVLVRPGDRIPADGTVIDGESAVDQAPVTGESTPVTKRVDDSVFAGTINGAAALHIRVTAAAQDNTIARVVRLVEEAQESKTPTERFIDRFARYYTPAVVAVAALVAIVPPLAFGAAWSVWIYKALAILLIGCPCALVISTPAAVAAALSAGARRGLLIKGGAVLETLGTIGAVAFDKTGTLTEGKPRVTDIVALGDHDENEILRLAAALEQSASHPLAAAIVDAARRRAITIPGVERAAAVQGQGITADLSERRLFLGSLTAARERAAIDTATTSRIQALNDEGKSVAVLVADDQVMGVLALRDEPRPEAAAALGELARRGVQSVMLTGDNARTAKAIGRRLDIEVHADLMPKDKQRIVRERQAQDVHVAKVGDGINDAPALAAADVGIAMGGGTDVALETGDAASLHGDLRDVGDMIALSRRTMANIRQNIGIAFGLKAVFLVTTIVGLTGLWPAILADTGATVLVTANALRLLRTPRRSRRTKPVSASRELAQA